jgi:hypothetical protein
VYRIFFRYNRITRTRTCVECGRTYQPSSRHLRCPACRSKDLCSCGSPKQGKSATCGGCRTVAGTSNGNWKGGQTRHKAGYIMVRAPGHPRAGTGAYVFEHILLMEEILGRYLLPGESVHHATAFGTTTGQRTWSYGRARSRRASASATPSPGRDRSWNYTEGWTAPPTMLTVSPEHSWRWRELNPRPSVPHQGFSGRSLPCFSQPRRSCRPAAERAQPLFGVPPSPAAGLDGGSS